MSSLQFLSQIGAKILSIFGEKEESPREHYDFSEVFSADKISDLLPYQSYDPETEIFFCKNSLGVVLEVLPLVGVDNCIHKEMLSLFEEVMKEESNLQFLLWADHRVAHSLDLWKSSREKGGGIFQDLAKKRSEHLLCSKDVNPRMFRLIISYSEKSKRSAISQQIQEIASIKDRMMKIFSSQSHCFFWTADDFVRSLSSLVNFDTEDKHPPKKSWDSMNLLSEQLSGEGGISVKEDGLKWGKNCHFKSYRVADYPDSWSLIGMSQLIGDVFKDSYRIPCPFVLHYGIHCSNQDEANKNFRRRMHLVENQGKSLTLVRMIPDLVTELEECDFVRRRASEGTRFVQAQFGVGIWSTGDLLADADQSVKSLFRINRFSLIENTFLHLPQYLSFLPLTWGEYQKDLDKLSLLKSTLSCESANLLPIQGEWTGTKSPGTLLLGRRGQILNWNPFDNQKGNYNVVVVGRSGSGKSVFMQEVLVSTLGVGGKVFIIDVGRSFEKTAEALSGQQIEFAQDKPVCLNPFSQIPDDPHERDQSLGMIKSIVATMAAPSKGTNDFENALIEKGVRYAWETKGRSATISDISKYLENIDDGRANSLAIMLTPYITGGIYSKYFEGENNVSFTNPLVLIELEELKEKKDLQSVVLQMFIMTITNHTFLGDRKTPFHICIDEAWDLLRGGQTGEFIETLARRLRKYNGSLVIGTQSVDDFYTTPGALAAFENSDWICLLTQKKSSIKRLAESGKIDLDAGKQIALESVTTQHGKFSEVMICDADGGYAIGRLILDRFSQLLYSTQANEYARIQELRNTGMSTSEAITLIIQEEGKKNA
ncbi:MAG: type-IV secretion system protein TraC [Waddliaceae bacterium]|nr:type-IV secretion system protein TraC [Waddliaceae bacterium]